MNADEALAEQLKGFLEGIEQMRKYMQEALDAGNVAEAQKWKEAIRGSYAGIEKWRASHADLF